MQERREGRSRAGGGSDLVRSGRLVVVTEALAARENEHCGPGRVTKVGPEDHAGDDEPGLDRQTRVRAHQAVGQQLDRDACRDVEADQRKERQDRRAERLQRDHAGAGGIVAISPKRTISAREPRRDPLAKRPQREAGDDDDSDQREVRLRPSFEAATSHPNTRASAVKRAAQATAP
jgi:hypothetical protein